MSNKNKKRILTLALVIALLSIVMVGGSLAWFTDNDSAKNTFTVGSVEIVQHEKDDDGSVFQQNQPLLPIVKEDNPSADDNYIPKVVTVENTGNNPAYIRTYIAVPALLYQNDDNILLHLHITGNGWSFAGHTRTTIDNLEYRVFYYDYNIPLEPDAFTTPLLEGVYLDARVDKEVYYKQDGSIDYAHFVWKGSEISGIDANSNVNVYVATRAVQSQGFEGFTVAEVMTKTFENTLPDFQ